YIAKKLLKYRNAASKFELKNILPKYPEFSSENELKKFLSDRGLFIETWGLEDINADPSLVGFAGSPTMVKMIESITLTGTGFKQIEPTDEGIREFVAELIEEHAI
ncbi:MAG: hypothetical protein DRP55_08095, partial [Spirochaetes bacterium]